jgi:drug/metabolite transporter (DMT)-like permease
MMPGRQVARPGVIGWYYAYCGLMALLYLGCILFGVAGIAFRSEIADKETPPEVIVVLGVLLALLGAVLMAAFVVAPFLPRRPWVWIYHIVLIALGMTSACCLPVCVPLLIFWIKPETRAYFDRA